MNNREAFEAWWNGRQLPENIKAAFFMVWQAALASQQDHIVDGNEMAKHQPCGCVICTCEHETQCQGCGAKHCGTHAVGNIPNPVYLQSQAQQTKSQWISVEERLPESKNEVLVFEKSNNVSFSFFDGKAWFINEYERNYGYIQRKLPDGLVTHWMPLPPAPEGDKP